MGNDHGGGQPVATGREAGRSGRILLAHTTPQPRAGPDGRSGPASSIGTARDPLEQEEINRLAVIGFAEHSRSALGDLFRLAEMWRPDVTVHATMQGTAPIVAAVMDIPTVVHNFGVTAGR